MSNILILCPTHDHSDTLLASIASVRAQRREDWEMVVLCDGSPTRTFEVLDAIKEKDGRIRTVSFPKSRRFGENHRDAEIKRSDARFVCHLSDDDIWLPNHLDCMLELLSFGDWVNQAPLRVDENGGSEWWFVNHGTPALQQACASRRPLSVGLNYAAYHKTAYLALEEGWTCAPWSEGTSDVFMWSKFFRQGGFTIASNARTTAIKFPSWQGARGDWSALDRMAEITPWLARAADPQLERVLQKGSSILLRLIGLFALHGTGQSPEDSMSIAGLRAVDENEPTSIGVDGGMMDVPLTVAQREEVNLAHALVSVIEHRAILHSAEVIRDAEQQPQRWAEAIMTLVNLTRPEDALYGMALLSVQTSDTDVFQAGAIEICRRHLGISDERSARTFIGRRWPQLD